MHLPVHTERIKAGLSTAVDTPGHFFYKSLISPHQRSPGKICIALIVQGIHISPGCDQNHQIPNVIIGME